MATDSQIITELIRQGKKLQAVKLLRDTTGMDLKRATEEVERIAAASPGIAVATYTGAAEYAPVSEEVRSLAQQGKKIEAIKLLRRQTGLGLKEAKEKVDGIAGVRHEGYGCFGVLLVVAVGIVVAIAG